MCIALFLQYRLLATIFCPSTAGQWGCDGSFELTGLICHLPFVMPSSGLSSWEPSPLQGMWGMWTFILLCDHIVTTIDEVCCPHEGMNLWHLGWFLWQTVWFAWPVCIWFVTTWSPTRLSKILLYGHLWFISIILLTITFYSWHIFSSTSSAKQVQTIFYYSTILPPLHHMSLDQSANPQSGFSVWNSAFRIFPLSAILYYGML